MTFRCFALLYFFPLALFRNILPKLIAEHFSGQKFPFKVLFKFSQIFDEVKKISKYTVAAHLRAAAKCGF